MSKLDENLTENTCNGNPLMPLFSGPHLVRSHPREALRECRLQDVKTLLMR